MFLNISIKNNYIITPDNHATVKFKSNNWLFISEPELNKVVVSSIPNGISSSTVRAIIDGNSGVFKVEKLNGSTVKSSKIVKGTLNGIIIIKYNPDLSDLSITYDDIRANSFLEKFKINHIEKVNPNSTYTIKGYEYLVTDGDYSEENNVVTVTNATWVCTRTRVGKSCNGTLYTNVNHYYLNLWNYKNIYYNFDKTLHIWFNSEYPEDCIHIFGEVISAIECDIPIIHTTQTHFIRSEYLMYGYNLIIHPAVGEAFELKLNRKLDNGKIIRESFNLEYLALNGGLDNGMRKIVGIQSSD